jgi:glycosyltransferase involved in cell wall biosynthesis
VPLTPQVNGTQMRILGILKYFSDRKDFISVDVVAGNQYRETWVNPGWNYKQTQEALKIADNVFVYEGKNNLYDQLYARSKTFYFNKLLREEIPVDSDYYTPPGYVGFIKSLVGRDTYNFVWVNTLNFANLAAHLSSSRLHTVIDTHDLCSQMRVMGREAFPHLDDLKFDYESNFIREVNLLNKFDTVISDSRHEFSILASHLPSYKLQSIPSLGDTLKSNSEHISYQAREFKHDLLFVANNTPPNKDGIKFFLNSIFPLILQTRPNTQLSLVGKICEFVQEFIQVNADLSQNINLLGYVPDLSDPYLQSKVVICPLLTGTGTKSKLIDAMSYSLPILTTKICASALLLQDGDNALITDDPVQFANHALSLLNNFQLAENLAREVKATFEQHYSTSVIYSKLDEIFGIENAETENLL